MHNTRGMRKFNYFWNGNQLKDVKIEEWENVDHKSLFHMKSSLMSSDSNFAEIKFFFDG